MDVKFKDLTADNLFDFCSVLDAIGIESVLSAFNKEEINAMRKSGEDAESVGVMLVMKISNVLIKKLPSARDEICSFFAGCMEWDNGTAVTKDEVKNFKISHFARVIRDFFKKDDLSDFFKEVAEYMGMVQFNSKN